MDLLVILATVCALLYPGFDAGAAPEGQLLKNEIALMGGAHRFREGQRLTDHVILRGSVGRFVSPSHQVLAHLTVALASDAVSWRPGEGGATRVEAVVYGLDYVFYPWPRHAGHLGRRFLPYLSAGLGAVALVGDHAHADTRFVGNVGAGVKYVLSRRFTFNAGIRAFSTSVHEATAEVPEHRLRIDSFMTGFSMSI